MKKNVCVIVAFLAMLVSSGPVLADYLVTGDLSSPGSSTYTGDLFTLLNGGTPSRMDPTNGSVPQYIERDYVVATGADGSMAVFSVGEINPGFGHQSVTITASGSQYNLSGAGQMVNNLTSIDVVHVPLPPGTYQPGNSSQFTIFGPGISTATYNVSSLPGSYTPVTESFLLGAQATPSLVSFTGVSLSGLLSAAGVNTSNPDQVVVAAGSDGYYTVMSMSEIDRSNGMDIVAYAASDGSLGATGANGFAKTILPDETLMVKNGVIKGGGRWISTLTSIEVLSVPEPGTLLLLGFALAGIAGLRRRFSI